LEFEVIVFGGVSVMDFFAAEHSNSGNLAILSSPVLSRHK